jgi:hypothetical protein
MTVLRKMCHGGILLTTCMCITAQPLCFDDSTRIVRRAISNIVKRAVMKVAYSQRRNILWQQSVGLD